MGILIDFNKKIKNKDDEISDECFNNLDILADEFVNVAKTKGFYDGEYEVDRDIAASHEEISELRQAIKKGKFNEPCDKATDMINKIGVALTCGQEEAADCVIQALKLARLAGIKDIGLAVKLKNKYNKTRPWLHGRKYYIYVF